VVALELPVQCLLAMAEEAEVEQEVIEQVMVLTHVFLL
jgi:hypothetical protein